MKKIWQIAAREFVATVFTKAFVIGLLIFPAMIGIFALIGPRLFSDRNFTVEGEVAVIDPTGQVVEELRAALAAAPPAMDVAAAMLAASEGAEGGRRMAEAFGAGARFTLVARPADADVEREKAWLYPADDNEPAHLALAVVHEDAVEPRSADGKLGTFDLYVPPNQDDRAEIAVQQRLRDAIIAARLQARGLDRTAIDTLVTVPRVRSVTVAPGGERGTVGGFNFMLPLAFMFLLFMGVMGSGQGLLTSTIEEKSSRVIEVLLSAVSPLQLMAGKLLGHMAISLLAMSLYIGLGLLTLASFSLFGLLDLSLIFYLIVFFLIAFFTMGSLMMAAGAAVNDPREAQSLMMPLTFVFIAPWILWMPISRNPESTLAVVASLLPPVNTFGMMLRLSSTTPPPAWQVWLSVALGIAGVVAAVWLAAKVFRIGLLMFGKPPDFKTLVRWVRAA
jgi:ABC-2 type transport system permease protein